jgi:LCP family protein required for cell wall assembly
VDRRGNEAARADTIMVALVDKKSASVKLLSIPRDTYTQVSGHGRTKINHAYAYGGEKLMLETVNKLLGLNIEKYVVADFQGFVNIVDILGGVRMNVEKRMYYPPEGIDLMPGDQVLDGDKALQYVRFRSDGKGDIGRVARQQEFLKQLADKALQISTVWKIPDLIKEASRSIETNLSIPEMISLGNTFKNIDTSAIEAKTLPGWPDYINEISYWIPDETELEKIFN